MKELLRNPDSFYKILELTVSTLDVTEMMTSVVEELRELFDCDRCTVYAVDREKNELFTEIAQKCIIGNFRLPIDMKSLAGFVAKTGKELMVDNVYDDAELTKIDKELAFDKKVDSMCSFKTKSMIAVPIKCKGETIGVFQAMNKPGGFLKKDLDAMREFSMILGLALNNALIVGNLKNCKSQSSTKA